MEINTTSGRVEDKMAGPIGLLVIDFFFVPKGEEHTWEDVNSPEAFKAQMNFLY